MNSLDLPLQLQPSAFETVELRPGRQISLPLCRPIFPEWPRPYLGYKFGNKAVLAYEGQPVFAELYILRVLQSAGWDGVWVSSYGGRKFLREMPFDSKLSNGFELKPDRRRKLDDIASKGGGCFDIFAWRNDDVLFCESKRHKRDRFRDTQRHWLNAALATGLEPTNFLIVEWDT